MGFIQIATSVALSNLNIGRRFRGSGSYEEESIEEKWESFLGPNWEVIRHDENYKNMEYISIHRLIPFKRQWYKKVFGYGKTHDSIEIAQCCMWFEKLNKNSFKPRVKILKDAPEQYVKELVTTLHEMCDYIYLKDYA